MKFTQHYLNILNNENKLSRQLIKLLKKKCDTHKEMKGSSASTFVSKIDSGVVYKVVPMKRGFAYFKSFPNDNLEMFKEKVNTNDCFLSIISIEFSDENAFVYTQSTVKKVIRHGNIKNELFISFNAIMLIYKMVVRDFVSCDLGTGNMGLLGNNILFYDLQGLRTYNKTDKIRLQNHLNEYVQVSKNISPKHKYDKVEFGDDRENVIVGLKGIITKFYEYHFSTFNKQQAEIIKSKLKEILP